MKTVSLAIILFLNISCSLLSSNSEKSIKGLLKRDSSSFALKDNAGEFILKREAGLINDKNQYVVKQTVFPVSGKNNEILEKNITISSLGVVKGVPVLRPLHSQYKVWFDGKKYSNEIKLDLKKKKFILSMKSPEKNWNSTKEFDLPNLKTIYCFYSQVTECATVSGFIKKAKNIGHGKMNFYIVWNGYPYFHEQYLNLNNSLISRAELELDEVKSNGNIKLSLSVDNQVIFYVLNSKYQLIKQFWVAQGLSLLRR